jgi:hypothetical protein
MVAISRQISTGEKEIFLDIKIMRVVLRLGQKVGNFSPYQPGYNYRPAEYGDEFDWRPV